jgi:NAD(P)-dependent dehydrogenase (short-subunit alcohol dehydrogenase family)
MARHPLKSEPKPPFPEQTLERPGLESELRPRPRYEGADYKPAGKLEGLAALITGGDSGIGRSVAVLYAKEGADVAIVHLPEEQTDADETRRAVEKAGRRCLTITGDVREFDFCKEAAERACREFGRLDVLVNNAAFQNHVEDIGQLTVEQFDRTFKTNVYGYFYMAKAALPYLADGGTVINTGSVTGLDGSKALLDYSATKGAIHAFTKSLAQQLAPKGIRVNCVAPGPVWTPLNPADMDDPKKVAEFGSKVPFGRPAQPEEIAPAYVFLASNADSSYMTGEVLSLLGGKTTAG